MKSKKVKHKRKYTWILLDKNDKAYFSDTMSGLVIEILRHRYNHWRKGDDWID